MTVIAFVDVETTGLDPDRHEPWEVGLVLRDTDAEERDVEFLWQLPVDLAVAEPIALTVGKFYERRWPYRGHESPLMTIDGRFEKLVNDDVAETDRLDLRVVLADVEAWALRFSSLVHGAVFVAANPTFDARMLDRVLRRNGACPGWHYRLVCVESLMVGYLAGAGKLGNLPVPWRGASDLAERCGISRVENDKHTALADARLVRDLYDLAMTVDAEIVEP